MAHLTLQIGTGLVVPFAAPQRTTSSRIKLRWRALQQAALTACGAVADEWPYGERDSLPAPVHRLSHGRYAVLVARGSR